MDEGIIAAIAIVSIVSLFIVMPWIFFHHITLWRNQKTLKPDEEKIMEDLWHAAKRMERRIEALERLSDHDHRSGPSSYSQDQDYRRKT